MIKFLDLPKQYQSIKNEIDSAISDVIDKGAFIGGPFVSAFEEAFANFQQTSHCIGVGNGTDALEIILEALDMPPNSEILVPANSFIASAEAIVRTGHVPVFCDMRHDDMTIDVSAMKAMITDRTAAVMPVHLYGHPCDMEELLSVAKMFGLRVIEDCAQAHGAEYKGQRIGALGDAGAFSFYPGKNLGAYGDGGAITCNDPDLARRCRMIANHGRIAKYDHEFVGRNSRLDGIQSAVLEVKLRHLETWLEKRRSLAALYNKHLSTLNSVQLPHAQNNVRHVYHLYVIRILNKDRRDHVIESLKEADIGHGVHYPIALPQLKAFQHLSQMETTPLANEAAAQLISLPMGEHLSEADVLQICEKLNNVL